MSSATLRSKVKLENPLVTSSGTSYSSVTAPTTPASASFSSTMKTLRFRPGPDGSPVGELGVLDCRLEAVESQRLPLPPGQIRNLVPAHSPIKSQVFEPVADALVRPLGLRERLGGRKVEDLADRSGCMCEGERDQHRVECVHFCTRATRSHGKLSQSGWSRFPRGAGRWRHLNVRMQQRFPHSVVSAARGAGDSVAGRYRVVCGVQHISEVLPHHAQACQGRCSLPARARKKTATIRAGFRWASESSSWPRSTTAPSPIGSSRCWLRRPRTPFATFGVGRPLVPTRSKRSAKCWAWTCSSPRVYRPSRLLRSRGHRPGSVRR